MSKKQIIIIIFILVIVVAGLFFLPKSAGSTKLDGFAQCLEDKGAIFYGAWWCPHCLATKKLFEASAKLLPYVECSTADKQQLPVCKEKGIEQYPTWIFENGDRLTGEVSLATLAEKTSCVLPQ